LRKNNIKLLKVSNENPELYKIDCACTGKGWAQSGKTPCGRLWEVLATDIYERRYTDLSGCTDSSMDLFAQSVNVSQKSLMNS